MGKLFDTIFEMVFYFVMTVVVSVFVTAAMLPKNPPSEPAIVGDAAFKKDIKEALSFLKNHSPQDYAQICKYVRTIRLYNGQNSSTYAFGIVFYSKNSYLNDKSVQSNSKYYPTYPIARTLIHESTHCKQIDREPLTSVIDCICLFLHIDFPTIRLSEGEALAAERKFLAHLGTPQSVINDVAGEQLLADKWWLTAKGNNIFNSLTH